MTSRVVHGIDFDRIGLPCRADPVCRFVGEVPFHATREQLLESASLRDEHERSEHGYVHVVVPTRSGWAPRAKVGRHTFRLGS